jgi:hypothetical protein
MQEFPVKIDALLEPLLTVTTDEHADEMLSQVITKHAEPVIKGARSFATSARVSQAAGTMTASCQHLKAFCLVHADNARTIIQLRDDRSGFRLHFH